MKHIQIASLKKRLLSSLIDLSLIAGLFCLFYFCVFTKVVANVQHYDHLNEVIKEEQIKSNLYLLDKDNNPISILVNNPKANEDDLKDHVKDFYTAYIRHEDGEDPLYWYNTHILFVEDVKGVYKDKITYPEEIIFEWVDKDNPVEVKHKDNYEQEIFNEFYRSAYASATSMLMLTDPTYSALRTMTWGNVRAAMYASMIATLIPCFIVPISLRNGKTVGKLITKLVVLTDDGYEYKRYKHIFRYLSFYIFEVFGGVVTIGLTLILTTTLTLFTKKRRALHDYISFSVVVDETNSVFYKDEAEEMMYQKKSEEKLTA